MGTNGNGIAETLAEAARLRRELDRIEREQQEQTAAAVERAKHRAQRKRQELLEGASAKARALLEQAEG